MKRLIIFGGGGFAKEVIWLARELRKEWRIAGILDAASDKQNKMICDVPVLGGGDECINFTDAWFVVAIGAPRARRNVVQFLRSKGIHQFATLIHPSVLYSEYVQFGEGTVVCAGSIITTQTKIGSHCIVNLGVTIGHDVTIGDYCTLAPQVAISGNSQLMQGVEVGSGSILVPTVTVNVGSLIAAGAVVSKSIDAENSLVAGVPARHVKTLEPFL